MEEKTQTHSTAIKRTWNFFQFFLNVDGCNGIHVWAEWMYAFVHECLCVKVSRWLELASVYMTEVRKIFFLPLPQHSVTVSRVSMDTYKVRPDVEMLSQLWTLRIPSDKLDIHLILRAIVQVRGHSVHTCTHRRTWILSQKWRFYALWSRQEFLALCLGRQILCSGCRSSMAVL